MWGRAVLEYDADDLLRIPGRTLHLQARPERRGHRVSLALFHRQQKLELPGIAADQLLVLVSRIWLIITGQWLTLNDYWSRLPDRYSIDVLDSGISGSGDGTPPLETDPEYFARIEPLLPPVYHLKRRPTFERESGARLVKLKLFWQQNAATAPSKTSVSIEQLDKQLSKISFLRWIPTDAPASPN